MIGIGTLRRSPWGRKALAAMNLLGSQLTRFALAFRRGPETVDGSKMYLSEGGGPSVSFAMALLSGKYEQETRQLLERVVRKGMTIVDVGAHVGYYALLFARWVGPEGRVFAFEPEPDNYALLRRNIALNDVANILAFPKAVSDHRGTVRLFLSSQGNDRHSIFQNPRSVVHESSREVSAVSLDQFLADEGWPRVDLVKMDVEGAEPVVLEGMQETIRRFPALKLVAELAPEALRSGGRDAIDFLQRLAALGFAVNSIEQDGALQRWPATDVEQLASRAEREGMINLFCDRSAG
jgi:FkbM family methyltransferase